jgi:hypothetical protein
MEKAEDHRQHSKHGSVLHDARLPFILTLVSGLSAIASAISALAYGWGLLTTDTSSLYSQYCGALVGAGTNATYNASQTAVCTVIIALDKIAASLYIYVPLLIIIGAFLVFVSVYYRGEMQSKKWIRSAFSIVFSVSGFVFIMLYLPFESTVIAALFSFIGTYVLVLATFVAYVILGVAGGIMGFYQLQRNL